MRPRVLSCFLGSLCSGLAAPVVFYAFSWLVEIALSGPSAAEKAQRLSDLSLAAFIVWPLGILVGLLVAFPLLLVPRARALPIVLSGAMVGGLFGLSVPPSWNSVTYGVIGVTAGAFLGFIAVLIVRYLDSDLLDSDNLREGGRDR
jgi:hypothetical protein